MRATTLNLPNIYSLNIGWKINFKILGFLGFLLILSLLVFYIYQINEITKTSFAVSGYEQKISKLSQENENLEINFSQTNSLASLEDLLRNSNYEKIEKVYYLRILGGQVAIK